MNKWKDLWRHVFTGSWEMSFFKHGYQWPFSLVPSISMFQISPSTFEQARSRHQPAVFLVNIAIRHGARLLLTCHFSYRQESTCTEFQQWHKQQWSSFEDSPSSENSFLSKFHRTWTVATVREGVFLCNDVSFVLRCCCPFAPISIELEGLGDGTLAVVRAPFVSFSFPLSRSILLTFCSLAKFHAVLHMCCSTRIVICPQVGFPFFPLSLRRTLKQRQVPSQVFSIAPDCRSFGTFSVFGWRCHSIIKWKSCKSRPPYFVLSAILSSLVNFLFC